MSISLLARSHLIKRSGGITDYPQGLKPRFLRRFMSELKLRPPKEPFMRQLLVIVGNLHVIAVAIAPDKADAPLSIDSDGVLPFAVSSQRLQLISRRRGQDAQFRRGMKLEEFPQGDAFDGAEAPAVMIVEKVLRLLQRRKLRITPPSILRRYVIRQGYFGAAHAKARCRARRPQRYI